MPIKYLSPEKVKTCLYWFGASALGGLLGSLTVNELLGSLYTPSFLQFWLSAAALPVGMVLTSSGFLNFLKSKKQWPMEKAPKTEFTLNGIKADTLYALREIDWEILKVAGQNSLDLIDPRIKEFLAEEEEKPDENQSWWGKVISYVTKPAKKYFDLWQTENAVPFALRIEMARAIHKLHLEYRNQTHLNCLPPKRQKEIIEAEMNEFILQAALGLFQKPQQQGFFESLGRTVYEEYQDPPILDAKGKFSRKRRLIDVSSESESDVEAEDKTLEDSADENAPRKRQRQ